MDDALIGLFSIILLLSLLGVAYVLVAIFTILEDLLK